MNLLSNWLEVLLSAIAVVLTIAFFLKTRQIRELAYSIITATDLIHVGSDIAERVQILFDGNPIEKATLLIVQIINTGTMPISSGDYEHPISIDFHDNVQLLEVQVSDREPDNLVVEIELQESIVCLQPTLLNSGDYFNVKILLTGYDENLTVNGRIIGIKKIKYRPYVPSVPLDIKGRLMTTTAVVSLIILAAFWLITQLMFSFLGPLPDALMPVLLFAFEVAGLIVFVYLIIGGVAYFAGASSLISTPFREYFRVILGK